MATMKEYGLAIYNRSDVENHYTVKASSIDNLRARILKEYRKKIPEGGMIKVVVFDKDGNMKYLGDVTRAVNGCNWYAYHKSKNGSIMVSKIMPNGSLKLVRRL